MKVPGTHGITPRIDPKKQQKVSVLDLNQQQKFSPVHLFPTSSQEINTTAVPATADAQNQDKIVSVLLTVVTEDGE